MFDELCWLKYLSQTGDDICMFLAEITDRHLPGQWTTWCDGYSLMVIEISMRKLSKYFALEIYDIDAASVRR